MFSINQLKTAKAMKISKNTDNSYTAVGRTGKYDVRLINGKPTCTCWHYTNKTIHDLDKPFMNIWWCSHLICYFIHTNYKGFANLVERELSK